MSLTVGFWISNTHIVRIVDAAPFLLFRFLYEQSLWTRPMLHYWKHMLCSYAESLLKTYFSDLCIVRE